jgi:hypothetical protein
MDLNLIFEKVFFLNSKVSEDGIKNFSRKPWFGDLSIDGVGIHFSHMQFYENSGGAPHSTKISH